MLLDSNVLIYAAEPGYEAVRAFIANNQPIVSVISKVEVLGYHRLTSKQKQRLERLFAVLPILPVTDAVVDWAIALRQKRKMSLGDALIAGTALSYGLTLVTANIRDYAWIEDIELLNPLAL